MLIALYVFIHVGLPRLGAYSLAFVKPALVIIITLAGIAILFSAIGMKVTQGIGTTLMHELFRTIRFLCFVIIRGIRWILFAMIPRIFHTTRNAFQRVGMNPIGANLFAAIIVIIIII